MESRYVTQNGTNFYANGHSEGIVHPDSSGSNIILKDKLDDVDLQLTEVQVREGGTTAERPSTTYAYQMYFDSTLGIPIWRNGTNDDWVNSSETSV